MGAEHAIYVLFLCFGFAIRIIKHDLIASFVGLLLNRLDAGREKGVHNIGHMDADGVGTVGLETSGIEIGTIAQFRNCTVHTLFQFGADVLLLGQHI